MTLDREISDPPGAKIKVIGIGGGGGNAVNTMIRTNIEGVDFITANTDVQSLRFSLADTKIQIGKELTRGLGAGADPDIGRDAMLEDRHAISEAIAGANMVFITAGMGGGTGTGGAAIAAQVAREQGALTVGVVTKPFAFEGKRRMRHAEEGIRRLAECVDTLITIPNQRLMEIASPDLSMIDAFRMADNVLVNAVKGISDIINVPGQINADFADVKAIMSGMGQSLMGIGVAEGPNRAQEAAQRAISSPLLEDVSIEGATGVLINITAGENLGMLEVNEACSIIQEAAHEDANIILGIVIDENVGQQVRVTVIATGFNSGELDARPEPSSFRAATKRPVAPPKPAHVPTQARPQPPVRETHREERAFRSEHLPHRPEPRPEPVRANSSASLEEGLAKLTFQNASEHAAAHTPAVFDEPNFDSFRSEQRSGASLAVPQDDDLFAAASTPLADEPQPYVTDEMDRKIDEALKIAEQLSKSPLHGEEDDLDIPSFLRKSNKDLSLS